MRLTKRVSVLSAMLLISGCTATAKNVGTVILPTSNKSIDVVQHRTDNKGCTTGFVLQTYDANGQLLDSKGGYGRSLGCAVVDGVIRSGGQVGAAALIADGIRHSGDTISNSNTQSQAQLQSQGQAQGQIAQGGAGGAGGSGSTGQGGPHGNNGGGNGSDDGTNPGTNHHHNNGDND